MRYVITLIFLWAHALSAQTGYSTANMYTTQNGLSDNTIKCIIQDSRGFLWIGTKEGLNRFDGFEFKKYFATKDPMNGLGNNTISSLLEYKKGQLLIASTSGLAVFNTSGNRFENEKIKLQEIKAGSGTVINSLYKDKDGNIWINHSGEMDILDSNLNHKHRFTNLPWAKQLKGIVIRNNNWFTDKQNRLWVFTDTSGIQIIDLSQKKIWNRLNNPDRYLFLKVGAIRSGLFDESSNTVWYAPWGSGLYRYDLKNNTHQRQDFGFNYVDEYLSVNVMVKAGNGKILCANGYGCFIVDTATLQYERVNEDARVLAGPSADLNSLSMLKTADNHYWLGTENGLFQLDVEDAVSNPLVFKEDGKKIEGLECNDMVRSASGNLYFNSLTPVLIEVNKDLQSIINYRTDKKSIIICVQEDKRGRLWVGTSSGFYQFHTDTKRFSQPEWLHPDLYHSIINTVYCDRDNITWIATRHPFGIYKYSSSTGKCEKIKNEVTDQFEKIGLSSRVSHISENDEHIWMASRLGGGLIGYNKKTGEWGIYPKKEQHKNLLSKGMIYLYADNKKKLWLSDGYATGLIQYDYSNDSVKLFTRNDGLASDFIKSVCTDGANNFWILTQHGISRFDISTEKVVFTDLLRSRSTNPIRFLVFDPLTKTVIATSGNDLTFYPVEKFRNNKKETLQPFVDKVWVNSEEISGDVNGQSLKLKPGQTNISIDFTTIDFSNADKIKFAYQLSGADHDWKYADGNRSAQYAVLTPGKYIFKIKVADENGNWSDPHESFSFTIVPYFWQTTLFKISAATLLVVACWLLFRKRIKSIRHEAELKQKVAETEMMALRAQMNPHFIFNCINSIDAMIQSNDKYQATVYLNKFARLIRNILDSSKQNLVPLSKDIETLQLYVDLELFRNENKFKAEINADPQLLQDDYQVPPLIIQPYVENAILHGLRYRDDNNGKLTVNIQRQNGTLNYEITDNGVGRNKRRSHSPDSKMSKSYGMQMSEDRVRIFNNEEKASVQITDLEQNEQPAGTKVVVKLKIQ
jgi:ligand-binding sensor domain-containing protein